MDEALPARKLFPEFGLRMVAVAIDFVLVLFIVQWLREWVLTPLGFEAIHQRLLVSVVLLAYFVASWLSPLRATPAQFLFAMRVVNEQGQVCGIGRSTVRTLLWIVDGAPWCFPLVGLITGLTSTGHRRVVCNPQA